MVLGCTAAVAVILLTSAYAFASEEYTHDGLHLRFGVGISAGGGTYENREHQVTFAGAGMLDGVQVGWNPIENLSVFAQADSLTLFCENKNVDNKSNSKHAVKETPVYGFLFGAGVGRYFMPSNTYVSGAVGIAFNNVSFDKDSSHLFSKENAGFGISLMTGKEWWVSPHWGLGVGVQLLYMNHSSMGTNSTRKHTVASGLLATATFN